MCDTVIVKQPGTNSWLFAKNSDRDPGEVQIIQYCTATEGLEQSTHPEHRKYYETLQYPQLLQAAESMDFHYKALISRPAWMWGAEMGINEKGVVIGNEAVFAKRPPPSQGLLGMDILRLTLHTASSAEEAVHNIANLLKTFGQGGNGSYSGTLRYHNSFLIADPTTAFVMETAATRWVARKVEQHASISNAYTIEDDYSLGDSLTISSQTNFSKTYASKIHPWFTKGHQRQKLTHTLSSDSFMDWEAMAAILRYNEGSVESLDHSMRSICMDAKGLVMSRTTASMIAEYHEGVPLVYFTGSPIPIFNPFIPFALSPEAFTTSPFAELSFGYPFALQRTKNLEAVLSTSGLARKHIADAASVTEEHMRAMFEPLWRAKDHAALAQACVACLAEEEAFRTTVHAIIDEF